MADHRLPQPEDYPNNSFAARELAKKRENPPEVKKVTKGKVTKKKKPFGRRFAEAFGARDGQGVVEYVLYDIIIPATKNMIVDSIIDGAEMAILGEVRSRRRGRGGDRQTRYAYDRVSYRDDDRRDRRRDRDDDRYSRRVDSRDCEDIVFDSKDDADEVRETLLEYLDVYGDVPMSVFFEAAGVTPDSPHVGNYGWTNLSTLRSLRVRDGWVLDLPRPVLLRR